MQSNSPKGWAKMPRRLISEAWYRDTYTARIYTHILLSSSISEDKFVTSIAKLADEMRLTTKQVRRALSLLTIGEYISTQSCAQGTTITLIGQTKGQTATPINRAMQANEGLTKLQKGQTKGQTEGQTQTPTTTAIQPIEGQTEGQTRGQLLKNSIEDKNKYKVCSITDANIIQLTTNFFRYHNYTNAIEETRKFLQYNLGRGNTKITILQCEKNLELWHQRNTRAQATNVPKYTYNEYLKIYGNTQGACWVDAIGSKNGGRLMRVIDAEANNIPILKICGE